MRNSNSKTIGAILKDLIKEQNLQPGLDKARIILAWPEVVGLNVARETLKVSVHNRVLFVSLRSAIVRSELLMLRKDIVAAINRKVGYSVIDDVVLR
ncbi:MAG TPA: DUF721 domain-containing protein [Williamwhitmania sp.]|nr:DUF721 domain-containing protein [Williamwhitmania sp.]